MSLRILIADDNEINRQFVKATLAKSDMEVAEANSGEAAIQSVRENRFDLILMDIHMPHMDGVEAMHQIRFLCRSEGWKPPQMIALTADARRDERERLLALGFDGFLGKPVTTAQLIAAIRQELDAPDRSADGGGAEDESRQLVLDNQKAMASANQDADLVRRLRRLLLKELEPQARELDRALADGELAAAAELLHKLIGSTAYCGAVELQHICTRLYQALQERDLNQVAVHYERFLTRYPVTRERLEESVL